jgi:hypothetical protein
MKNKKLLLQFIFAWVLVVIGVVLIFFGFFAEPIGEIDPSVLTAFGEILTFSGAILGIDYRYKFKSEELDRMDRNNKKEQQD